MISEELKCLLAKTAPYRWSLGLVTLLLFVESALSLTIPWLAGQLAGPLLVSTLEPRTSTTALLALILGLSAAIALCQFVILYKSSHTSELLVADLRTSVYDHLQSLPLAFYHQRRQGNNLALLTRDVEVLSWFMSGSVLGIAPQVLTFFGAIVLMIRIDLFLGTVAALLVPLCYIMIRVLGRRIRHLSKHLADEHAMAVAIAEDQLRMLPVIKSFTFERQASERYANQLRHTLTLTSGQLRMRAALGPLVQFATAVGVVLLLWLAGHKVVSGTLTADAMISFFLYGLLLARPLSGLAATYGQFEQARGAAARLQEVLGETPEPFDRDALILPSVRGRVEFRDISFAYPGREPVLCHVDLTIAAGETVALTGLNGSGKSTLMNLLLRFYIPQKGHIYIDDIDIATVSLSSLRRQIALVPQHALLSTGTVRENLAFGKPHASRAEVEKAARAACAHDFISAFPDGYDTRIGDYGVTLSGGQQQRLSLARALLKGAPILILDEAISMYDPEGEQELLHTIQALLEQRTVIVITHHPASLALADRIVHLENGVVRSSLLPSQPKGMAYVRD